MAARTVLTTDTLETFRTTFNSLSSTDIGDPATLTTTATSIVGAINEIDGIISTTGVFTFRDSSSTTQSIIAGDVMTFASGNNITATVSSTDTLTIALNSSISGLSSISSTEITGGVVKLLSSTIKTTDSSPLNLQEIVNITNTGSITGVNNLTGTGTVNFLTDVQKNGVSLATSSFAIAQAVALG
jgi:hypothetical protein